jgi:hypothetical protein
MKQSCTMSFAVELLKSAVPEGGMIRRAPAGDVPNGWMGGVTLATGVADVTSTTSALGHLEVASAILQSAKAEDKTNPHRALVGLYGRVDRLLRASRFLECNQLLLVADPRQFSLDVALGFLTITYAARSRLPARPHYLAALRLRLQSELRGPDEIEELLFGLG